MTNRGVKFSLICIGSFFCFLISNFAFRSFLVSCIFLIIASVSGILTVFFIKESKFSIWIFCLILVFFSSKEAYKYLADVPAYLNKNYAQLQGIGIVHQGQGRSSGLSLEVNGKTFNVNYPGIHVSLNDSGNRFVVWYLPHTGFPIKIEKLQ
ncbi:hypothetical protein [Cohnella lupini]|uniref:Uncharacterized protein n=1 Tax=Cohnella lupini TaxID=1294267 RepID=A0A3D9HQG3_9BACL|nr:hypothetical protein [Cohnella lupini]RED51635.1 hypothetical protein DFP95_14210 [Cohnella lupini]